MCDYRLLDNSSKKANKNVRNNIHKYFTERGLVTLGRVANGIHITQCSDIAQKIVLQDIQIRSNDKDFQLTNLTPNHARKLLDDKEFTLFMYNRLKAKNIPNQMQCWFKISDLIERIYRAHAELYEQLYDWVCKVDNNLLKQFMNVQDELLELSESNPGYCEVERIDFKLHNFNMS